MNLAPCRNPLNAMNHPGRRRQWTFYFELVWDSKLEESERNIFIQKKYVL